MTRTDWQKHAACAGHPPDLFYLQGAPFDSSRYRAAVEAATRICRTCPVQTDCYQTATTNQEKWGVWGGRDFTRDWRRDGRRKAA